MGTPGQTVWGVCSQEQYRHVGGNLPLHPGPPDHGGALPHGGRARYPLRTRFGHGYHGHGHGYIVSPCTHTLEEVEKEICHLEPEKKCETKTHTYKVITGYEKGECKEIEVCKHPLHHKREASPHGYGYIKCEKEKKEICKQKPTVEEKSKDHELCRLEPKKVCEMKTVKVPKLVCEEAEEKEEA